MVRILWKSGIIAHRHDPDNKLFSQHSSSFLSFTGGFLSLSKDDGTSSIPFTPRHFFAHLAEKWGTFAYRHAPQREQHNQIFCFAYLLP
jgi:hypothetical protein